MTDIFTLCGGVLLEAGYQWATAIYVVKNLPCTTGNINSASAIVFFCKMTELMVANQSYSCLTTTGKQSAQFLMILFTNSNLPISLVLAQRGYFKEQSFINYLKYLLYWKKPEYAKFLK